MGLTVAIDARAAAEVTAGRGRYVRQLLLALAELPEAADDRYVLLARQPWGELDERFSWEIVSLPDPAWHVAAALVASRRADVLLSTNSYLTAWFATVPTAVVVYDLVAFAAGARAQSRAARIERATIRPGLRRARALPCISEATRADLVGRFPSAAAKASVIPLAASERFSAAQPDDVAARHGLSSPYALAVGTLEPRKNLERLLAAWMRLPAHVRDAHALALVGPRGWEGDAIMRAAEGAGAHVLGRVSDEDLAALYAGCAVFAYPSLYEGFGLPVLEAMSAGAPVVTSTVSSLPEVAGDAAILVDPLDTDAISDAIARVLTDPALAQRLAEDGRRRAGAFSWEHTARDTRQLLAAIARR